jgi:hypothetical protein
MEYHDDIIPIMTLHDLLPYTSSPARSHSIDIELSRPRLSKIISK